MSTDKMREALVMARAGLVSYQENCPQTFSECENEALDQIDAALSQSEPTQEKEKTMGYNTGIHHNPDAQAWAKFFMKTKEENPDMVIDESLMLGWFANAMMAMHDHIKQSEPAQVSQPVAVYSFQYGHQLETENEALKAENEGLNQSLRFVERWANHHAVKPCHSAEEALSCIQHYPCISDITKSYEDGAIPETRDPYAEIEALKLRVAELEEQQARGLPRGTLTKIKDENKAILTFILEEPPKLND